MGLSTSLGSISQSHAKVSSERYRGEERRGEERRGEARRGEERQGEERRGEVRQGEVRRGEEMRGEARRGRRREVRRDAEGELARGEVRRDAEGKLARVNFFTCQNISNQCLTRGADTRSTQLRIDPNTIQRRYGLFARILVDVDLSVDLPAEIVIKSNNGVSFVQAVDYEKIPYMCSYCGNVGHCVTNCKFVKPAPSKSDVPTNGRGRSRRRRPRQRRKRAASQVYVPKQQEGMEILVDSSPSTRIDYGEGPSFAQKSPVQV
ncbi:hypothetical protein ACLB2K_006544 [Fragaria x ananassa]